VADPVAVIDRFVDAVLRDRGANRFEWEAIGARQVFRDGGGRRPPSPAARALSQP
jgi:hypothetical protein